MIIRIAKIIAQHDVTYYTSGGEVINEIQRKESLFGKEFSRRLELIL